MANAEIELYRILATVSPTWVCLSLIRRELSLDLNHGSTLPKTTYLPWSSRVHAALLMCATLASLGRLSPLYFPMSSASRAERYKPCYVALVPTLGCSRSLPPSLLLLASVLSGNITPGYVFLLKDKRSLHSDTSSYPAREKWTHRVNHSHRRFRSCLDERPPARREIAGRFTPVCTHFHAHTSRSGSKTAQGGAPPNPTLIRSTSVLLLLLLYVVDATDSAVVLPLTLH